VRPSRLSWYARLKRKIQAAIQSAGYDAAVKLPGPRSTQRAARTVSHKDIAKAFLNGDRYQQRRIEQFRRPPLAAPKGELPRSVPPREYVETERLRPSKPTGTDRNVKDLGHSKLIEKGRVK
jgi:hypothetical protein